MTSLITIIIVTLTSSLALFLSVPSFFIVILIGIWISGEIRLLHSKILRDQILENLNFEEANPKLSKAEPFGSDLNFDRSLFADASKANAPKNEIAVGSKFTISFYDAPDVQKTYWIVAEGQDLDRGLLNTDNRLSKTCMGLCEGDDFELSDKRQSRKGWIVRVTTDEV